MHLTQFLLFFDAVKLSLYIYYGGIIWLLKFAEIRCVARMGRKADFHVSDEFDPFLTKCISISFDSFSKLFREYYAPV